MFANILAPVLAVCLGSAAVYSISVLLRATPICTLTKPPIMKKWTSKSNPSSMPQSRTSSPHPTTASGSRLSSAFKGFGRRVKRLFSDQDRARPIEDLARATTSTGMAYGTPLSQETSDNIPPEGLLSQEPTDPETVHTEEPTQPLIDEAIPPPSSAVKVAFNFTLTLLKKLPDIIEIDNPLKTALGIARAIIEIKETVQGNLDDVESQIASTAAQLSIVQKALDRWPDAGGQENPALHEFKRALSYELKRLHQLAQGSRARNYANHEEEKGQIAEIFGIVNEARMRFELETSIRLYDMVDAIGQTLKRSLRKDLEASDAADYKYVGEEQETLYRVPCTRGTRVNILDTITGWANGHGRQSVFWLFGPAGSGKSTIAYTIARRFELTSGAGDTIVLGGNFFCSRQVKEARHESQIIRTIAYHLALKCKPFADALERSGKFETIHRSVLDQIKGLLVGPWEESRSVRRDVASSHQDYLIVIDAVDELANGGTNFLRNLLAALNEHDLPGIKFLVTSRSDPKIVEYVESFKRKELYRLQDVEKEQVQADIGLYLKESFPYFSGCRELETLLAFADGLFICAATLVRHLEPGSCRFTEVEQRKIIQKLTDSQATSSLNLLYDTILSEAFKYEGDVLATRIDVLYTFLCTAEPITTAVVDNLLSVDSIPSAVLSSLHAVLYTDSQHRVLSYHKSFSDFMFDRRRRPVTIWRDPAMHNRRLTESCFHVMNAKPSGLRFNIANIPTSFILDSDNETLKDEIQRSISATLGYSCRSWSYHLALASEAMAATDPLHGVLTEFLQFNVLFWIEAMNLLGSRGQCHPMLLVASQLHRPASGPKFLDVASFALYFSGSPAALSTPHLYLSALATWGQDSEPFKRWRDRFGGIPRFTTNGAGSAQPLISIRVGCKVCAIALACNDTRIITGSEEGLVQLWNLTTGEQEMVFEGHTQKVRSVTSTSDGTRVVSGSDDCTMRAWNTETGVEEYERSHNGKVWSVAISDDGSRIASGSQDKSVRIWDARTGEGLMELNLDGRNNAVQSVAFSSDGTRVVFGSDNRIVRVWNTVTGNVQRLLGDDSNDDVYDDFWRTSVAFSIDDTRIISGSWDGAVRLWDAEIGQMLQVLPCAETVNSVAFSSDSAQVVAGLEDGSVRMWNALTGENQGVIRGHGGAVTCVSVLGSGTQVASGSEGGLVCVWDLATGSQTLGTIQGHSGEGLRAVATGQEQRTQRGHEFSVRSVAFSPNGACIVSGSDDGTVRLWDVETGQEQRTLRGHEGFVLSVAFSPNGTRIVSGSSGRTVQLWDVETGQEQGVLTGHGDYVESVAFSPNGACIVSGSDDCTVRLWDVETGQEQRTLRGHEHYVLSVVFSPDGTWIVSGSEDKTVRLWDVETGQEKRVLRGHESCVRSVAFSPDGACIVSGSEDKTVRVWDAETGQEKRVLRGHEGHVWSVAFSPNGAQIVSGSFDRTARLWDAETGHEQRTLRGHEADVWSVAFSPDGTHIVSGSEDSSVRVWDLDLSDYMSEVTLGQGNSEEVVTGWLLPSSGLQERLMYAPDLPRTPCILTISREHPCSFVDFSSAAVGDQWQHCYTPAP